MKILANTFIINIELSGENCLANKNNFCMSKQKVARYKREKWNNYSILCKKFSCMYILTYILRIHRV